ncbi:hypothetical protein GFV16_10770 [Bacillus megaterium]|uniref:hypothetical protein n=1 Tax=Priestia megaterium TaxID=1404 RepID=UPI0013274E59|nr:hypothetical protein [Priestia megaterium]MQR86395.1 hypothetical protein [Priestia megaterium]
MSKIEEQIINTRVFSKRREKRKKFKERRFFSVFTCLVFIGILTISYYLYRLYSLTSPQTSLIIMYFSIIIILIFLWIIMIFRHNNVKADNHYYQYLFMVITTIVGFTFSTSFQEWLKENEEKQELILTLELAIKYYDNLLNDIPPIDIPVNEVFSTPEEYRDFLVVESNELKVSSEMIFNMSNNNPQKFKNLSPELRVFLGSLVPLTVLYERLKADDTLDTPEKRVQEYYDEYHYLITQMQYRRDMLQAEMNRLNGNLNEKQFKKLIQSIESKRVFSLPNS